LASHFDQVLLIIDIGVKLINFSLGDFRRMLKALPHWRRFGDSRRIRWL